MAGGVLLLMAQVDDASGELLGEVLRQLAEMGAKNVQLLSSLAKKGRPGHVLLIDILAEQEAEVAALLAGELGVWGYRVLHSDHKHFGIERHDTVLAVDTGAGVESFPIRLKRILNGGQFLRVKAEHDEMAGICAGLRAKGCSASIAVLKAKVEVAVGSAIPGKKVRITLN
ncbi:nickel insertion protein [Albidovulum sp.]|uniref:nickel insertion protein n=1 Tax=Albidovulum sp. TaxID=1872424 RepID=UPI0039B82773